MMMKMVEPYIIIMSPGSSTPTLSASAAASIVPAMTGVPAASPVSSRRARVTMPAMSVVHSSLGQALEVDDVGRQLVAPGLPVDDVERARNSPPSNGR